MELTPIVVFVSAVRKKVSHRAHRVHGERIVYERK